MLSKLMHPHASHFVFAVVLGSCGSKLPTQQLPPEDAGWITDFNVAVRTAEKTGKDLLMCFVDRSPTSRRFRREILDSKNVENLDGTYVLLLADSSNRDLRETSQELRRDFFVEHLPALVLCSRDGRPYGRIDGYRGEGVLRYGQRLAAQGEKRQRIANDFGKVADAATGDRKIFYLCNALDFLVKERLPLARYGSRLSQLRYLCRQSNRGESRRYDCRAMIQYVSLAVRFGDGADALGRILAFEGKSGSPNNLGARLRAELEYWKGRALCLQRDWESATRTFMASISSDASSEFAKWSDDELAKLKKRIAKPASLRVGLRAGGLGAGKVPPKDALAEFEKLRRHFEKTFYSETQPCRKLLDRARKLRESSSGVPTAADSQSLIGQYLATAYFAASMGNYHLCAVVRDEVALSGLGDHRTWGLLSEVLAVKRRRTSGPTGLAWSHRVTATIKGKPCQASFEATPLSKLHFLIWLARVALDGGDRAVASRHARRAVGEWRRLNKAEQKRLFRGRLDALDRSLRTNGAAMSLGLPQNLRSVSLDTCVEGALVVLSRRGPSDVAALIGRSLEGDYRQDKSLHVERRTFDREVRVCFEDGESMKRARTLDPIGVASGYFCVDAGRYRLMIQIDDGGFAFLNGGLVVDSFRPGQHEDENPAEFISDGCPIRLDIGGWDIAYGFAMVCRLERWEGGAWVSEPLKLFLDDHMARTLGLHQELSEAQKRRRRR